MSKNIHLITAFWLLFTFCISSNAAAQPSTHSWSVFKQSYINNSNENATDNEVLRDFVNSSKQNLYIDSSITITESIDIKNNLNITGAGYLRSWIEFAGPNAQFNFTNGSNSTIQHVYLNNKEHPSNVALIKVTDGTLNIKSTHIRNKQGTCVEKTAKGILTVKLAHFFDCRLAINAKIKNEQNMLIESTGFQFDSVTQATAAIDIEFDGTFIKTIMPTQEKDFDLKIKNNHFYGLVDDAYIKAGNNGSLLVKGNYFESQQQVVAINTTSDIVKIQNNLMLFNSPRNISKNIIVGSATKVSEITANTISCPCCTGLINDMFDQSNSVLNDNAGRFGISKVEGLSRQEVCQQKNCQASCQVPILTIRELNPSVKIGLHDDKIYQGETLNFELIVDGYDKCSINNGNFFDVTDDTHSLSYTPPTIGNATLVVECVQNVKDVEDIDQHKIKGSASFDYQVWGDPTLTLQWQKKVNGSWVNATEAHYGSDIRLKWSSTFAHTCTNQNGYSRGLEGEVYAKMTYYRYSQWTCYGLNGSKSVTKTSTLAPKYEVKIRWCEAGKTGDSRWQCGTLDGSSYNLITNAQTFVEFHWEAPGATSCTNSFGNYANSGKKGPFKMSVSATSTMTCTWPDNTVLGDQANEVIPAKITIR